MFSSSLAASSMNSFSDFNAFSSFANSSRSRFIPGFSACHLSDIALRSAFQNSKASVRTCAARIIWSVEYFMGLPFAGVLRNSQFKAAGSPTPFATTRRQPGHARLTGVFLPHAVDAALTSRSGFAGRAVGGAFYVGGLHAANHRFFCAFEPHNSTQQS